MTVDLGPLAALGFILLLFYLTGVAVFFAYLLALCARDGVKRLYRHFRPADQWSDLTASAEQRRPYDWSRDGI